MIQNFPESVVGKNPEIVATFVVPYLKALDDSGVQWAVAHGWYGLPKYARHDIDLLLKKEEIKRAVALLRKVAAETGWIVYGSFRNSALRSYWIARVDAGELSLFQIDIMDEVGMRALPFFKRSGREELKHRWKNEEGIWCVTYAFAAASDILKELIALSKFEGTLRHRHVEDALKNDAENLRRFLLDAIKDEKVTDLVIQTCREGRWQDLSQYASAIRRGFMHYRLKDLPAFVRYAYDYFRFRFFPYLRLFVAIVGPDGCGKTSIGDAIERRFYHRPFLNVMRIHSNFSSAIRMRDIKCWLAKCIGRTLEFDAEKKPGTRGMGMTKPLSGVRSMIYVLYYGIWFALGRVQLWKWRTFSSIIIADRYYYDYYYLRGHMNSPRWFKRLVGLIVPKPTMIVYLDRPAKDIFSQKPELEIDEIERQQREIRETILHDKRAVLIDASKGLESTIAAVNGKIQEWLLEQRG